MKRLVSLGLVASMGLFAVGCATSAEEEREHAEYHRQKAAHAAAVGDYQTASREQAKAYEHEREAADKSLDEMEEGEQPPPPPPQQYPVQRYQQYPGYGY